MISILKNIKFNIYFKSLILLILLIQGCCPPEGVDKSITSSTEFLVINFSIFNQTDTVDFGEELPYKSQIQLVLNNSEMKHLSEYRREFKNNKFIYVFSLPSQVSYSEIRNLNIDVDGFSYSTQPYNTLEKYVYQRESHPIAKNSINLNDNLPITCRFNSWLSELILPKAKALSCKTKKGSMINYKPGVLVNITLFPNI